MTIPVQESQKNAPEVIVDTPQEHDVWSSETPHHITNYEKKIAKSLHKRFLIGGGILALFTAAVVWIGINIAQRLTFVDTLRPDYSSIKEGDEDYWEKRTQIDIQTAQLPANSVLQSKRLQRFLDTTIRRALQIESYYNRTSAIEAVALTLTKNNTEFTLDTALQKLGESGFSASVRCRILVSQALMYLRLGKLSAAKVAVKEAEQLSIASDQRLNSEINEKNFCGTITVLAAIQDSQALPAYFKQQLEFVLVVSLDQQSRAYRLIAGEQIRVGMTDSAFETIKRIRNPVETARALELLLVYSARPVKIKLEEPKILDLPPEVTNQPLLYPERSKQIAKEVFQWLAKTADTNKQIDLLQRIANSRLMCDTEMYKLFRESIAQSTFLSENIKQIVLKQIDNPQSPQIRAALNLPEKPDSPKLNFDTAQDDWGTSEDVIPVEIIDVDSTPLAAHFEQQMIQILITTAQSYLSVNRYSDAALVLRKAAARSRRIANQSVKVSLMLKVGEAQLNTGAFSEARNLLLSLSEMKKNGEAVSPDQSAELARLQIIGRYFDDALRTLETTPASPLRDEVYRFLALEQIHIDRLSDAAATLAKMSEGKTANEVQHSLRIAEGQGKDDDFSALGISAPGKISGDADFSRCCERLVQAGLLKQTLPVAEKIMDSEIKSKLQSRIIREYLLLYNTYRGDSGFQRSVRQYVQKQVLTVAGKTGNAEQAAILWTLLDGFISRVQTESDKEEGRKLLSTALDLCRKIPEQTLKAENLARLISAKIALEKPAGKKTYPFITKESNPAEFEELSLLIEECRQTIEDIDESAKQGLPCALLSVSLAQVGRVKAANLLLERTQESALEITNSDESVNLLLLTVPVYKALNEADLIPKIYDLAIKMITKSFIETPAADILDWRIRDSSIDTVVRNEIQHGFVDEALRSASRINEPVIKDRIFRAVAYIYLDQGNFPVAEALANQITVRGIQRPALQNVLFCKQRAETKATDSP
ncbi:hypothetical protein FACS189419_01280 [Planctomycetales bacterium]|nr:hypothetical protein FACS189419_01280 [Planctomycetales bacterium]